MSGLAKDIRTTARPIAARVVPKAPAAYASLSKPRVAHVRDKNLRGQSRVRASSSPEHRLQIFQAFQIGPTPEQSNWNFVAPLITTLDRLVEVGRVVALFLEYFHARIKPLVGVVLVVSDARTENVHQREALVLNGALEHFNHVFLFAAERARHIGGTANDCHRDRIDRVLNASVRRALCFHSLDAGGRALAGG